jgi:hypothetical protein
MRVILGFLLIIRALCLGSPGNISNESNSIAQEFYKNLIDKKNREISELYDLKKEKRKVLNEALIKSLNELIDNINNMPVFAKNDLSKSAKQITEIKSSIERIQNQNTKLDYLSELKMLENIYISNNKKEQEKTFKELNNLANQLVKHEAKFAEQLDQIKKDINDELCDFKNKLQEGGNYNNMTVMQKTNSIEFINKTLEEIAGVNDLNDLGWYRNRSNTRAEFTIMRNNEIRFEEIRKLSFQAKATSSSIYDKSYESYNAVDGNLRTEWALKGRKGSLSVSYVNVEKPVKKIYILMRRFFFDDPIYGAKVTINGTIQVSVARINTSETLIIELNHPITLENIYFTIINGKNNPGINEIILSSD